MLDFCKKEYVTFVDGWVILKDGRRLPRVVACELTSAKYLILFGFKTLKMV